MLSGFNSTACDLRNCNGSSETAAYIQNKLNQILPELASGEGKAAVIYMVPQSLLVSNPEAYKPKLVSIGPYHQGSPDLQPMEANKLLVVRDLCNLTGVTLVQLVHELDQEVKEPRIYYRQKIDLVGGDQALSAQLLIDGCFLFSYLGGLQPFINKSAQAKPAPHVYSMDSAIQHDILLLENQVPSCVLKAIVSAISLVHHQANVDTHINVACGFIEGLFQYIPTAVKPNKFDHLVDLCYQYRETGIRFKQMTQRPPISLLDITFSRGVLRIPRIVVDERTDYFLRNIVAYEQESFDSSGSYVTAYVLFMSQLVSKAEDVTLLSEKDILVHQLGSDEEVSDMFKKMSKGIVFDFDSEYHLKDVTVALEKHYRDRRNRWMALLRHTYFSNPWLILGAIVAMVAFALSVSQAALNFLRFARNPK